MVAAYGGEAGARAHSEPAQVNSRRGLIAVWRLAGVWSARQRHLGDGEKGAEARSVVHSLTGCNEHA